MTLQITVWKQQIAVCIMHADSITMKATSRADVLRPSTKRVKLKQTTWCLGDTDVRKYNLLWCDKTPKGKRNKPAKINGVQHHEIADSVEHVYYQPVQ